MAAPIAARAIKLLPQPVTTERGQKLFFDYAGRFISKATYQRLRKNQGRKKRALQREEDWNRRNLDKKFLPKGMTWEEVKTEYPDRFGSRHRRG